jgi:hypothetical protein
MNDKRTLEFYNQLFAFKVSNQEVLIFPPTITPLDRRLIHTLAHNLGLEHVSRGANEHRQVVVSHHRTNDASPPMPQLSSYANESQRRGLNRAATTDFSEARDNQQYGLHTLNRQGSGLLDVPGSPSGFGSGPNLRGVKSFADLRSYSPSPVPSTASFPAVLGQNVSRYADYGGLTSGASGTPSLTPTSGNPMNARDESFLMNGISNMSLRYDGASAARSNGRLGGERENHGAIGGVIGSQRTTNGNHYNEQSRNGTSVVPERQPRGPGSEWGSGFSRPRQNGHGARGSGDLDINGSSDGWDDLRSQDTERNGQNSSRYL